MKSFGKSNIGLIRKVNEDAFYYQKQYSYGKPYICIVADGMGGHNAGEVASRMAVTEIKEFIEKSLNELEYTDLKDYETLIKRAFLHANKVVYEKSMDSTECIGMGTTLTAVLIIENSMIIGHVGDSRVYFIRNGIMERITSDHSYVAELIKNGTIKPEEASKHPQKNLITRAIGTGKKIDVDVNVFDIKNGDYILMCTDGLSNMLDEDEILNVVISDKNLNEKCSDLIDLANNKGGYDNITVIVIEVDEGGAGNDR